jgi:hypothetical protein
MTEAEPPNILDHLGIVPIAEDQLQFGHKPVSVPLSIYGDTAIITSMWATLRTVCKVTRAGDRITFWREPPKKQRDKSLKHRANPDERWRTPDGA